MFYIRPLLLMMICAMCSVGMAESFVDHTIHNLIQEKVGSDKVIIEHQYNSQEKINKIRTNSEKIANISLEEIGVNHATYTVRVNYTDGETEILTGHYSSYIQLPIASRYIQFGDIIQATDITTQKTKIESLDTSYLTDIEAIVGLQAKKYIHVGKAFKNQDLAPPHVIKNGDPVNITYSSGVINLKTIGTAMGSGAIGDVIKVKNNSSGVVILGQIINKNTIKVSSDEE